MIDIVTTADGSMYVVDQVVEMRSIEDAIDESQKLKLLFESPGFADGQPGSFAVYREYFTGKLFEEVITGDPDFPAHFREVDAW